MPTLKRATNLRIPRFWVATALMFLLSCTVAPAAFAQTFTVLYSFTGRADGGNPAEGLVLDSAGNLYGTTQYGGTGNCTQYGFQGCGTVFKVANQGTESVLYSFQGGSNGEYPWAGLALDNKGNLFGTTVGGGQGFGVVFSVVKSGMEHVLHRFTGGTDGAFPWASLALGRAGHLFGTTTSGGDLSCGTRGAGCGNVFELYGNKETVAHHFAGAPSDGNYPGYGALIDSNDNLYGTTGSGGAADAGTLYKVDRNGKYTVLYSFSGKFDGCEPLGRVAADENGNLYGATSACGDFNQGTVFRLNSTGFLTVLYSFGAEASISANAPFGGVVRDRKGNLYGTTLFGGQCGFSQSGCGTVFELGPSGSMSLLHTFNGTADGASPWCNVTLDEAGNLYGTTTIAGQGGAGTVWKIAP